MTTRRSFLAQCLALAAAPAIVRADSLMRIVPRGVLIIAAPIWLRAEAFWQNNGVWVRYSRSHDGTNFEPHAMSDVELRALTSYMSPKPSGESDIRILFAHD